MKLQTFSDGEVVALMAGDAAGRFGKNLIDPACLDARKHLVEAGTLVFADAAASSQGIIGKNSDDFPAFDIRPLFAKRNLIFDGSSVLEIAGIAGVDEGLHGFPAA